MGNSLSLLTNCLPQEPQEEKTEQQDQNDTQNKSSVLDQKKALAPKPLDADEEEGHFWTSKRVCDRVMTHMILGSDWEAFEDTFGSAAEEKVSRKNTKALKSNPVNSSRDNISPLSALSTTPPKKSTIEVRDRLNDSEIAKEHVGPKKNAMELRREHHILYHFF